MTGAATPGGRKLVTVSSGGVAPVRPATRAVAYIRVSDEHGRGEALTSPEIQLTAIRDHCARAGYVIVEVLEDLDRTGRLWKRRQVERAVAMIEDGEADVLVVWKISRVSRNRRDWAIAVDRVESAGGHMESATEPNDRNASGRFSRGMLAELAVFESERIGETWAETHERRASQGLPHSGAPRWGYAYNATLKLHEVDPITGPELAQVYRRYVAGSSIYSLTLDLNDRGFRTASGYGNQRTHGHWSTVTLRRVLDSGFGAGFIVVKGQRRPGAHEAVIGAEEWEAYLSARDERRPKRSSERSRYLLSGLVRCSCGSAMNGGAFGRQRTLTYRCGAAASRGVHKNHYPKMAELEAIVLGWLASLASEIDDASVSAARVAASQVRATSDGEKLNRELLSVTAQLEALTREYLKGVIPESTYVALRDELVAQQESLGARQRASRVASRRPDVATLAGSLIERWDEDDVETRRAALRELIRHVVVEPATPTHARVVTVVPHWTDGEVSKAALVGQSPDG